LHDAVYRGNIAVINALVAAGADVNVPNKHGNTALDGAVYRGNIAVINALVAAGARGDFNIKDRNGRTLSYANASGAITLDLSSGTSTGYGNDSLSGITNIIGSTAADNLAGDSLANSIAGGGGVDTTLHAAIDKSNIDVIKVLVAAGADIDVKDKSGETPLDKVASRLQAAEALIKAGVTPHIKSIISPSTTISAEEKFKEAAIITKGMGIYEQSDDKHQVSESFMDKARQLIKQYDPFALPGAEAASLPQPPTIAKNWQDSVGSNRYPSVVTHNQLSSGNVTPSTSSQMPEMALMGVIATLAAKFVGRTGINATEPRKHVYKLDVEQTTQKTMLEMHDMSEAYAKAVLHVDAALKIEPDDNDLIKLNSRIEKISELSKAISFAYDKGEFGPKTTKKMDNLTKKQAKFLERYNAIITDSHADKIKKEKSSANTIGV
jgi:hypothetical protein